MTPNRPGCRASTSTDTAISADRPSGWQVALTKALVSPRRKKPTNQSSWRARKVALAVARW